MDNARPSTVTDFLTDSEVIHSSFDTPERFGVLFERHFRKVYSYSARRLGRATAENIAAQTFVVAFENRRTFNSGSPSALSWLFGIATNLMRNHLRKESHSVSADFSPGNHQPRQPSTKDSLQQLEIVEMAEVVHRLQPEYRDVILLYAWADLTYEEIGEALTIPVGTVASRLNRARQLIEANLLDKEST